MIRRTARATVEGVAERKRNEAQKKRVAAMLRALMANYGKRPMSLGELEKKTGGKLSKSRLGNYTQGIRLMSLEEATILAAVFKGTTPAQILCVDEDMVPLSPAEKQMIEDLRALPENMRMQYIRGIAALALAHREPVSDRHPPRAKYAAAPRDKLKRS